MVRCWVPAGKASLYKAIKQQTARRKVLRAVFCAIYSFTGTLWRIVRLSGVTLQS